MGPCTATAQRPRVDSQAKRLRTSANKATCNNVYINRNLTKVEERLAYEERCRRRKRQPVTSQTETASTRRHENLPPSSSSQPAIAATTASSAGRPRQRSNRCHHQWFCILSMGALRMRDWKMRDWNYREQETCGTPRVA